MKALHLVFGATIALGVGDAAAERGPSGGGSGSGNSRSSSRMGRRASSSIGRDGRSSINDYGSSSSTNSRRSVDDILDLDGPDGLLMDDGYADSSSFNLLDDDFGVDGLMDDFENGKDIMDYSLSEDEFEGLSGDSDEGDDFADGLMGGSSGRDGEDETFGQGSEKGALYDAYNLLHSLAQVRKEFDGSMMISWMFAIALMF